MKKLIYFLGLLAAFTFSAYAQIPNGGFETWTNGDPVNWFTLDIFSFVDGVTQTNDSHSGSSAAKMEIVEFGMQPYPPYLQSYYSDTTGIPISSRYASLIGYYKLSTLGTDELEIIVSMSNSSMGLIGIGYLNLNGSVSSYTQFSVPIEYFYEEIPETAIIQVILSDSTGSSETSSIGSWAILDDFEFSGIATGIKENIQMPTSYSLDNNYPNPFNPTTKISYSIPEQSFVTLSVFDELGKEITTLVSEQKSPGKYEVQFDAGNLASGIYFYRLNAGNFVQTKKMLLMK